MLRGVLYSHIYGSSILKHAWLASCTLFEQSITGHGFDSLSSGVETRKVMMDYGSFVVCRR